MSEFLALTPVPTNEALEVRRTRAALWGAAVAGLAAVALVIAHVPAFALFVLGVPALSALAISLSGPPTVPPVAVEAIASHEARELYRGILVALGEVERAAADTRSGTELSHVLERSRSIVEGSGRIALLANPVERYLATHDRAAIANDLDRLRARAETSSDDALSALSRAASARARQLALWDELAAKRDAVCARLELARAALESFAAAVVKLHILGDEQTVAPIANDLEGIAEDLDTLAAALQTDLAA